MNLVGAIKNKKLDEARKMINQRLMELAAIKIEECKKKVASDDYGILPFKKSANQVKVAQDVLEADEIGKFIERDATGNKPPASPNDVPLSDWPTIRGAITPMPSGRFELRNTPPRIEMDKLHKDKYGNTVVEEETLEEASRTKIIKARIRNGKVERRKKISNMTGYTMRDGKLTRMSAKERRDRKMGARKAKMKRRAKMTRILMKRKRSLQKRERLGL